MRNGMEHQPPHSHPTNQVLYYVSTSAIVIQVKISSSNPSSVKGLTQIKGSIDVLNGQNVLIDGFFPSAIAESCYTSEWKHE